MIQRIKKLLIVFLVLLIIILYILYNYAQKELLFCPKGELINTIKLPNTKNKLNIYLIDGGSLSANAMRVEFENDKKRYNIYYCYSICDPEMKIEWVDNENVIIDDIIMNVYKDKIYRNELVK